MPASSTNDNASLAHATESGERVLFWNAWIGGAFQYGVTAPEIEIYCPRSVNGAEMETVLSVMLGKFDIKSTVFYTRAHLSFETSLKSK